MKHTARACCGRFCDLQAAPGTGAARDPGSFSVDLLTGFRALPLTPPARPLPKRSRCVTACCLLPRRPLGGGGVQGEPTAPSQATGPSLEGSASRQCGSGEGTHPPKQHCSLWKGETDGPAPVPDSLPPICMGQPTSPREPGTVPRRSSGSRSGSSLPILRVAAAGGPRTAAQFALLPFY